MPKHAKDTLQTIKKTIQQQEYERFHPKPFNIDDFFITEEMLSLSHACRPEWGFVIDVDLLRQITEQQANQICAKIIQTQKLYQLFKEELIATRNLVHEGDPFTITRKQYLDILESIWKNSHKLKQTKSDVD